MFRIAVVLVAVASVAQAQPPAPKEALPERTLTAFPLRELSPEKAMKELARHTTAMLTPLPEEHTLLVYADEKTTRAIEADLEQLGEVRRVTTVVEVAGDLEKAIRLVGRFYPTGHAPTMVPVPGEGRILIHAGAVTTRDVLVLLPKGARVLGQPVAPEAVAAPEPTFAVEFRNAPWADVLKWYARISGLQLVSAIRPPGTVTLTPGKDKKVTVTEIADMLNELLSPHKMILMRRDTSFFIWPTDEKIDPYLIPRIRIGDLPRRAKLELCQIIIPMNERFPVKDHADEIKKLKGPTDSLLGIEKGNCILLMGDARFAYRVIDYVKALPEPAPMKP